MSMRMGSRLHRVAVRLRTDGKLTQRHHTRSDHVRPVLRFRHDNAVIEVGRELQARVHRKGEGGRSGGHRRIHWKTAEVALLFFGRKSVRIDHIRVIGSELKVDAERFPGAFVLRYDSCGDRERNRYFVTGTGDRPLVGRIDRDGDRNVGRYLTA